MGPWFNGEPTCRASHIPQQSGAKKFRNGFCAPDQTLIIGLFFRTAEHTWVGFKWDIKMVLSEGLSSS